MELIVAFDATSESKKALRSAVELSQEMQADVTALHAVEKGVSETQYDAGGHPIIEGFDTAVERGDRVINTAQDIADELDADINTDITYGNPVDSIIEYAQTRENASIYVGHRDIASQQTAIGSVAQRLIQHSPIPVTVVN